jgi:hypothetical protein
VGGQARVGRDERICRPAPCLIAAWTAILGTAPGGSWSSSPRQGEGTACWMAPAGATQIAKDLERLCRGMEAAWCASSPLSPHLQLAPGAAAAPAPTGVPAAVGPCHEDLC